MEDVNDNIDIGQFGGQKGIGTVRETTRLKTLKS